MPAGNALESIYTAGNAEQLKDPGASGTILVDRSPAYLGLRSTAAESRTLPVPDAVGAILTLAMEVDGGDITVTVASAYNESGNTTFVFSEVGQFAVFQSVKVTATVFAWRLISHYGIANASPTEAAILDGLTATTAELNQMADASGRVSTLTAAGLVLTAADSGKIFFIDNATGFVAATLPAVAGCAGVTFTFINKTPNTSGNHTIVTSGSENVINGNVNDVGGAAGDTGTTDDTVSFVANQSVAGDKLEIFSDGVKFFGYAISRVAAGMTFTTAS